MASGKQHSAASAIIGTAMILPAILYYPPGLLVSVGCFLGIVMPPDLDVKNPVYAHYTMGKIGNYANSIFGFLLKWSCGVFWKPYAMLVPRHRHWISHFPVVGTLIRVIYIMIPVLLIGIIYPGIIRINSFEFYLIVLGLIVSDTAHWIMDGFPIYSFRVFLDQVISQGVKAEHVEFILPCLWGWI